MLICSNILNLNQPNAPLGEKLPVPVILSSMYTLLLYVNGLEIQLNTSLFVKLNYAFPVLCVVCACAHVTLAYHCRCMYILHRCFTTYVHVHL